MQFVSITILVSGGLLHCALGCNLLPLTSGPKVLAYVCKLP
jgi:hypothetical protein